MARPDRDLDPYTDPDTGLLRNLVGARDQQDLDYNEGALTAVRGYELSVGPVLGSFDLAHLCAVHRKLFEDVYPWAGEIRTVDIAKGNTLFAMPHYIESEGRRIFDQLAKNQHLRGLAPDQFSEQAAELLGDINALHPFREGNGRTQRAFISQLAKATGYAIAWENITQAAMTEASIAAMHGNNAGFATLIRANLTDLDQRAAIDLGKSRRGEAANVLFPEPGKTYSGRLIGVTERYLVQGQRGAGGAFVLHRRAGVAGDVVELRDKVVTVSYPKDGLATVRPARSSKDLGL